MVRTLPGRGNKGLSRCQDACACPLGSARRGVARAQGSSPNCHGRRQEVLVKVGHVRKQPRLCGAKRHRWGLHCVDDSPFPRFWLALLAQVGVTGAGALAAVHLLGDPRWVLVRVVTKRLQPRRPLRGLSAVRTAMARDQDQSGTQAGARDHSHVDRVPASANQDRKPFAVDGASKGRATGGVR